MDDDDIGRGPLNVPLIIAANLALWVVLIKGVFYLTGN